MGKCTKSAITKDYFPTVQERLSINIKVTPNIAAMTTGHGKTRAYLNRFKLLDNATCVCKRRPDHRPPTVAVQTASKSERNPEEKHRPPRSLANKQRRVNYEVPETIHNLERINRL